MYVKFKCALIMAVAWMVMGCGQYKFSDQPTASLAETNVFQNSKQTLINTGTLPIIPVCAPYDQNQDIIHVKGVFYKFYSVTIGSDNVISLQSYSVAHQDPVENRSQIINNKKLPIDASSLAPGFYTAVMCTSDSPLGADDPQCFLKLNNFKIMNGSGFTGETVTSLYNFHFEVGANVQGPVSWRNEQGALLYVFQKRSDGTIYGPHGEDDSRNAGVSVLYSTDYNTPDCQVLASPLIMDTLSDVAHAHILLSSPQEGVAFDIQATGQKQQISWPLEPEKDMFLVLPENGQVLSGRQLFGNYTLGPNGKTAANGFLALAKYAVHNPNLIDAHDPIYPRLMLWGDSNRDGIVEPGELHSLADKKIKSISLNYIDVYQSDNFGNQTRERSWVEDTLGISHMMVDIWFQLPTGLGQ